MANYTTLLSYIIFWVPAVSSRMDPVPSFPPFSLITIAYKWTGQKPSSLTKNFAFPHFVLHIFDAKVFKKLSVPVGDLIAQ